MMPEYAEGQHHYFDRSPGLEAGMGRTPLDCPPSPSPQLRPPGRLPSRYPPSASNPTSPEPADRLEATVPSEGTLGLRQKDLGFSDGSAALFSMCNDRAASEDIKMTDRWKEDADGILVFTGLFSATVATFLGVSVQNLQLNSQDASAFYLAQLYQLNAASNGSTVSIPPTLSDPSSFTPSPSAIWINALWFLSLVVSLVCALLATLLKQWTRRYLQVTTQPHYSPLKRSRLRTFMKQGVERFRFPLVIEALPALVHISVFLFFGGLAVFLFSVNHTVFAVTLACLGVYTGLYLCITIMPIVRYDSPYFTPLTTLVSILAVGIPWLTINLITLPFELFLFVFTKLPSRVFCLLCCCYLVVHPILQRTLFFARDYVGGRIRKLRFSLRNQMLNGMVKEADRLSEKLHPELDDWALAWTFESLHEDHELEQFLAATLVFYGSSQVKFPDIALRRVTTHQLPSSIIPFLDRHLSSPTIAESDKQRRAALCFKVISEDRFLLQRTFLRALTDPTSGIFQRFEFVSFAESHGEHPNVIIRLYVQCILYIAIDRIEDYDERWSGVTMRYLGLSKSRMAEYLAHGRLNVQLYNFLHFSRWHVIGSANKRSNMPGNVLKYLFRETRYINAVNAIPELQHEFCALWNGLLRLLRPNSMPENSVKEARASAKHIVRGTRAIYLQLHAGTRCAPTAFNASTDDDDAVLSSLSSYPSCTLLSHRLQRAPPNSVIARAGMEMSVPKDASNQATPRRAPGPPPDLLPATASHAPTAPTVSTTPCDLEPVPHGSDESNIPESGGAPAAVSPQASLGPPEPGFSVGERPSSSDPDCPSASPALPEEAQQQRPTVPMFSPTLVDAFSPDLILMTAGSGPDLPAVAENMQDGSRSLPLSPQLSDMEPGASAQDVRTPDRSLTARTLEQTQPPSPLALKTRSHPSLVVTNTEVSTEDAPGDSVG